MFKRIIFTTLLTLFSTQYSLSEGESERVTQPSLSDKAIEKLKTKGEPERIATNYMNAWRYSVTDKNWFLAKAQTISYFFPDSTEQLSPRLAINYVSADLKGIDILTLYDYAPFDEIPDSAVIRNDCSIDRAKTYKKASEDGNLEPFQPMFVPTEEHKRQYQTSMTEFIDD